MCVRVLPSSAACLHAGYIYEKDGFTREKLAHLIDVKVTKRQTLKEYKGGAQPSSSLFCTPL